MQIYAHSLGVAGASGVELGFLVMVKHYSGWFRALCWYTGTFKGAVQLNPDGYSSGTRLELKINYVTSSTIYETKGVKWKKIF